MSYPEPPKENGPFEKYDGPSWTIGVVGFVLLALTLGFCYYVEIRLGRENLEFVLAFVFALLGSMFIHESLHYVTAAKLGYDPVYVWPNHVYVPDTHVERWDFLLFALAPQILSIAYVVLLFVDLGPSYRLMIGIGLLLNLPGACQDFVWGYRRLKWSEETKVIVSREDQQTYVSFPD